MDSQTTVRPSDRAHRTGAHQPGWDCQTP